MPIDATLNLSVSKAPLGGSDADFSLHQATSDWGEGASDAGSPGGAGVNAQPGDATWVHSFYMDTFWSTPGGDFVAAPSATRTIADEGFYSFNSAQMAADVQLWLDNPTLDYGWFILGVRRVFKRPGVLIPAKVPTRMGFQSCLLPMNRR